MSENIVCGICYPSVQVDQEIEYFESRVEYEIHMQFKHGYNTETEDESWQ